MASYFRGHLGFLQGASTLEYWGSFEEEQRRQSPRGAEKRMADLWRTTLAPQLFDPEAPLDLKRSRSTPASPLYEGIARLGVGRFIGRKSLRRQLSMGLRDPAVGVVLLYGLGGIGKSALATELAESARKRAGARVIAMRAPIHLSELIKQIRQLLAELALLPGTSADLKKLSEGLAGSLGEGTGLEPAQQIEMVIKYLGSRVPLLLFLDNFEDELIPAAEGVRAIRNPELARVLSLWSAQPGPSKLLITSRYPFPLENVPSTRFRKQMVGPLDRAESRKLMLRFPALRVLSGEELGAVHNRLGGHPRSIEYLAAMLEHGEATWGEVGADLDSQLLERQLNPRALHDADDAVRATLAQASSDILLESLLVEAGDSARDLLCRAAVYRQPVGRNALAKQLAGRDPKEEIERLEALTLLYHGEATDGRSHYLVHRVTAKSILKGASNDLRAEAHKTAAEYFEYLAANVSHRLDDLLEARWHWLQCGEPDRASQLAFTAEDLLQRWGFWTQAERLNAETWGLDGVSEVELPRSSGQ